MLSKISKEVYEQSRFYEPELSELGVSDSIKMGQALKKAGVCFDVMFTSAHKRAILSAKCILETFTEVPVHLMLAIHEVGGVYMRDKTYPGLSIKQAQDLLPQLTVSDEQAAAFGLPDSGWFKSETKETVD